MADERQSSLEQQSDVAEIAKDYARNLQKPGKESLLKAVSNALKDEYIYGGLSENLSPEVKDYFLELEFLGIEDLDGLKHALHEELNRFEEVRTEKASSENREVTREVLKNETQNVRDKLTFLQEHGPQPVQWIEDYEHQRVEERQEVMSKVIDLNPGDTVTYKEPVGEKIFTVVAHNRQPKVIILQSEDGEQRNIRYRTPAALEESVTPIGSLDISAANKPRGKERELGEEYKEQLANADWTAKQTVRRAATQIHQRAA